MNTKDSQGGEAPRHNTEGAKAPTIEDICNRYGADIQASWDAFYENHRNPVPRVSTYASAIRRAIEEHQSAQLQAAQKRIEELEGALGELLACISETRGKSAYEAVRNARALLTPKET